jgi:hypothetical protein
MNNLKSSLSSDYLFKQMIPKVPSSQRLLKGSMDLRQNSAKSQERRENISHFKIRSNSGILHKRKADSFDPISLQISSGRTDPKAEIKSPEHALWKRKTLKKKDPEPEPKPKALAKYRRGQALEAVEGPSIFHRASYRGYQSIYLPKGN